MSDSEQYRRGYLEVMQHALTDIDYLLKEGFDTNVDECEIDGIKDTIKELKEYLEKKERS